MNNTTRIEEFQRNSDKIRLMTITGHGSLIHGNNDNFKVPSGKYIIFISKPGYWISLKLLYEDIMMRLLHSEPKLRLLLHDKLPQRYLPNVIKYNNWNWKNHIYPPGTACPNMYLETYDRGHRLWDIWYNEQCGVRTAGRPRVSFKNLKITLKQLINRTPENGIFFVFGCRGDPHTYAETETTFRSVSEPRRVVQKYHLPKSILVSNITKHENSTSRYFTKKRILGGEGLTLRKVKNEPSAKRRTIAVSNNRAVNRVSRNININRFVKAHNSPGISNAELRNLAHQKSVLNGKNYTLREITNSIRRLRYSNTI
jgi:hypothetical protein